MTSERSAATRAFELMTKHLAESTVALFAAYGLAIEPLGSSPPLAKGERVGPIGVATIGYTGPGLRGALLMLATGDAIGQWLAAIPALADGAEPGDALGEFSNMLLGRLKARLLMEGLPLQLATPTTALGSGLSLSLPPSESAWLTFAGAGWQVAIRLDAHFESGFALATTLGAPPAEAGEAILF